MNTYTLRIEVRDKNGVHLKDENGNKRINLTYNDVKVVHPRFYLEGEMKTLTAWMPGRKITVSLYILDVISNTYVEMYTIDEHLNFRKL